MSPLRDVVAMLAIFPGVLVVRGREPAAAATAARLGARGGLWTA
jgi:hypothetical protein